MSKTPQPRHAFPGILSGLLYAALLQGCGSTSAAAVTPPETLYGPSATDDNAQSATTPPSSRPRPQAQDSFSTGRHADPGPLATAPLRNHLKVRLNAPLQEVWELLSTHEALPSYSPGLVQVTLKGTCSGPSGGTGCTRTCTFSEGPPLDEQIIAVQAPNLLATSAVEPNDYGLTHDLTLITLQARSANQTELWWRQYYDHPDLDTMETVFDEALTAIGQALASRFGGHLETGASTTTASRP